MAAVELAEFETCGVGGLADLGGGRVKLVVSHGGCDDESDDADLGVARDEFGFAFLDRVASWDGSWDW